MTIQDIMNKYMNGEATVEEVIKFIQESPEGDHKRREIEQRVLELGKKVRMMKLE